MTPELAISHSRREAVVQLVLLSEVANRSSKTSTTSKNDFTNTYKLETLNVILIMVFIFFF